MRRLFLVAALLCAVALPACISPGPVCPDRPKAPEITDVHRVGCRQLCEDSQVGSRAKYLYSDSSWPTIYCVCGSGRHFHLGATFEWLEQETPEVEPGEDPELTLDPEEPTFD